MLYWTGDCWDLGAVPACVPTPVISGKSLHLSPSKTQLCLLNVSFIYYITMFINIEWGFVLESHLLEGGESSCLWVCALLCLAGALTWAGSSRCIISCSVFCALHANTTGLWKDSRDGGPDWQKPATKMPFSSPCPATSKHRQIQSFTVIKHSSGCKV